LKHIIDEEQTAVFRYGDIERIAAPAEILLDDDGHVIVRAFQLSPEQGWRTYFLSDIRLLGVPGDRI
jgi:hypothetical protein